MQRLLMPLPEAWAALGISRSTFYTLIAAGQFHPVSIGRRTLIPTVELEAYVASLRKVS